MISVDKDKKPKYLSWALKTSMVEEAMDEAGIEISTQLYYYVSKHNTIFRAFYWLPNQNVPYPRAYLTTYTVPGGERQSAIEAMQKDIIPSFIKWLSEIVNSAEDSTITSRDQCFEASYSEGIVEISDELLK